MPGFTPSSMFPLMWEASGRRLPRAGRPADPAGAAPRHRPALRPGTVRRRLPDLVRVLLRPPRARSTSAAAGGRSLGHAHLDAGVRPTVGHGDVGRLVGLLARGRTSPTPSTSWHCETRSKPVRLLHPAAQHDRRVAPRRARTVAGRPCAASGRRRGRARVDERARRRRPRRRAGRVDRGRVGAGAGSRRAPAGQQTCDDARHRGDARRRSARTAGF